ncbi:endonuclease/exonuclease/phosphatase family protein [Candidatus Saccharibacteria bacterium]|nr:endonuclease/exonuclease/phosphatase family protein [Candidatus Saccharibacteria bacterium]
MKNFVIIQYINIKVICLNLWQGGILIDEILDFLHSEDADILMLQEVYNGTDSKLPRNYRSLEVLNSNLSYKCQHHAPTMLDRVPEGKIEQGNAVFSKLPIINSDVTFFDIPYRERDAFNPKEFPTTPRNLQHVTIELKKPKFRCF